jgi:hypothetical protein
MYEYACPPINFGTILPIFTKMLSYINVMNLTQIFHFPHFLKSVIITWPIHEFVGWKRHRTQLQYNSAAYGSKVQLETKSKYMQLTL